MRQIVLDTETTGLSPSSGHRITEIGCVELINRKATGNEFQCYINPERPLEKISIEITGLTDAFLADKPLFADVVDKFIDFVGRDAEFIIHNAPFDIGFLRAEFSRINRSFDDLILNTCTVLDTLKVARNTFPGQRNSLDALCSRFDITNFDRDKHGALLDSQILAEVYLLLTGGQCQLFDEKQPSTKAKAKNSSKIANSINTIVVETSKNEEAEHKEFLAFVEESNQLKALWNSLDSEV